VSDQQRVALVLLRDLTVRVCPVRPAGQGGSEEVIEGIPLGQVDGLLAVGAFGEDCDPRAFIPMLEPQVRRWLEAWDAERPAS
jgi:hypothetical protein